MSVTRTLVLPAVILIAAAMHVQAGFITVHTTHNILPGGRPGPFDPFISLAVGGGGAAEFRGRYYPVSGIYSLSQGMITVPVMEVSDFRFSIINPGSGAMMSSGFSVFHELIISIFDSELGEIGTIEVEESGSGGLSVANLPDPVTGGRRFNGTAENFDRFTSVVSLTPELVSGPGAAFGFPAFTRQIQGREYTIEFAPGNAGTNNGFRFSDLVPDASPTQPLMTLGLRIEATNVVPEPGTFAMFLIGGAFLAGPTWLRRKNAANR